MGRKRRSPAPLSFLATAALALLGFAAAAPEVFTVTLWANDDSVERLPNVVSTSSHPCGASAEVRLMEMPPYRRDEGALGTELIVESDAGGGELARWSVPLDYQPLALRGSEVLLDLDRQRLWIGTDGSIRRQRTGGDYPAPAPAQCPRGGPFDDSEYAVCARFADLRTGRPRLLRYEAPCT